MTTKAYKVQCLPLTKAKKKWLLEHVTEYARIYNFVVKFLPSLPEKYYNSTNPSLLYNKWVTKNEDNSQLLNSDVLSGLQILNAIKDACANFKTIKLTREFDKAKRKMHMNPNIIKFENSEYDIIRVETNGKVHFGIAVGGKKKGKRELFLPLRTNSIEKENKRKEKGKEWGIIDYLELGIKMKKEKKVRDKELALKRKEKSDGKVGGKREKGKKAGIGAITYNFKNNTVSIPLTINTPKFQKKDTLKTFIGINRGIRNSVVLSAIRINGLDELKEYQEIIGIPAVSRFVFDSLRNSGCKIAGVKIINGMHINNKKEHLRQINRKRQKSRKNIGNHISNITDTVSHQISKEIVEFANKFENPVVFFEDLDSFKHKKLRHKHGGKSTKRKRKMLSQWEYGNIKKKTIYKLELIGIWTMNINPAFISQTCSHCGAYGIRSGVHFKCERCRTGIGSNPKSTVGQYNADINASVNVALRGLYVLYGYKAGSVAGPNKALTGFNEQPDENVTNPLPMEEMNGIEGIKTRKSETIADYPEFRSSGNEC